MASDKERDTVNFLCLDGGGVRGLSTLIILRKLLCLVNVALHGLNPKTENTPLLPGEVFDLISGTSTGGLIAIMIVKLGMTVDECIDAYKQFAQNIFSKPHPIGRLRRGLGRFKKYRGTDLRKVVVKLIKDNLDTRIPHVEAYKMEETGAHPDFRCTVLCRELDREAMTRTDDVTFLCSERCRPHIGYKFVTVADAACATTAAPTYFPHVEVLGKCLVDGGYGNTNNPSVETWDHYQDVKPHRRSRAHIIVNIGTGSRPLGFREKKGIVHRLPSASLKELILLFKDLKRIATASDNVGHQMDRIAKTSEYLEFDRFSADCGNIHCIKLDAYKSLSKIEELTNEYLKEEVVLGRLKASAQRLADVYRARHPVDIESSIPHLQQLHQNPESTSGEQQEEINLRTYHEPALSISTQRPGTTSSSFVSAVTTEVETIVPKGAVAAIIQAPTQFGTA